MTFLIGIVVAWLFYIWAKHKWISFIKKMKEKKNAKKQNIF